MNNVFVPNHRVVSFTDAIHGKFQSDHFRDIPLYNSALFPALSMSIGVPALGLHVLLWTFSLGHWKRGAQQI